LSGWTKGRNGKHLTEEYRNKLKQHAIKQWQEVKVTGSQLNQKIIERT
jgi:hypothetical protein